ncbi:major facilitator superfamily domain-containing protein [Mycena galopus ATCC 62051]|nr:major facilitator superfamily domain-containing protein [Mycena galopus ATCC 62051]
MSLQGLSSPVASPTVTLRESLEATSCAGKTEKPCDVHGVEYPKGLKLVLITMSMFVAIFIQTLDNTTTPTIIPSITDEFDSLADVGWYGSAYLLAISACQLLFGKLYSVFPLKWVYVGTISAFELGILICGVAPNSNALIIGRAIVGLGTAGILTGSWIIISRIVPLQRRPLHIGGLIALYGIVGVVGPLLGGVLVDKLSWRWAFYINIPLGAVTIFMVLISFNSPAVNPKLQSVPLGDFIQLFGPLVILIPGIVSLLLALRWGGSKYPWNSGRIVAFFIIFGVLVSIFIALQIWQQDQATVPPRIVMQRSIFGGAAFLLCLSASHNILVYFLPIYFQAIKGVAATKSAIYGLPLILATIPAAIISGVGVAKMGYYTPFVVMASVLVAVASGLLSTFAMNTRPGHWIGFQVIYGLGYGIGIQQPIIAAQTVLTPEDIPVGTALMSFFQTLGGAVFVSVAQNVFTNGLRAGLISRVPGVDPNIVLSAGATTLRFAVDAKFLPAVLSVYNEALVSAIHVCLGMACFSIVGALIMEWKNVKSKSTQDRGHYLRQSDPKWSEEGINQKNKLGGTT